MNVKKGSKIGLLFADGATIDYEVREPVTLDHLIDTLLRLARLDSDTRTEAAPDDEMPALIERSSFGTDAARIARASVSHEHARRLVERSMKCPTDDEIGGRAMTKYERCHIADGCGGDEACVALCPADDEAGRRDVDGRS